MELDMYEDYLAIDKSPQPRYAELLEFVDNKGEIPQLQKLYKCNEPTVISAGRRQMYILDEGYCAIRRSMDQTPLYFIRRPGTVIGSEWLPQMFYDEQSNNEQLVIDPLSVNSKFRKISMDAIKSLIQGRDTMGKLAPHDENNTLSILLQLCLDSAGGIDTSMTLNQRVREYQSCSKNLMLLLINELKGKDGITKITHQRLGSLVGLHTVESVGAVMKVLRKNGDIEQGYKWVKPLFSQVSQD